MEKSFYVWRIDCGVFCYDACKEKSGNVPPFNIKNIFISLNSMLKSENV